jgi:hypothetical protein
MEIVPVVEPRTLRRFIRFPRSLYDSSSVWVSPLDRERLSFFDPKKNPFFDHGTIRCSLAVDWAGKDVGRIAAIDNPRYAELQGRKIGFWGFFDSVDDPAVSGALTRAAELLRALERLEARETKRYRLCEKKLA